MTPFHFASHKGQVFPPGSNLNAIQAGQALSNLRGGMCSTKRKSEGADQCCVRKLFFHGPWTGQTSERLLPLSFSPDRSHLSFRDAKTLLGDVGTRATRASGLGHVRLGSLFSSDDDHGGCVPHLLREDRGRSPAGERGNTAFSRGKYGRPDHYRL